MTSNELTKKLDELLRNNNIRGFLLERSDSERALIIMENGSGFNFNQLQTSDEEPSEQGTYVHAKYGRPENVLGAYVKDTFPFYYSDMGELVSFDLEGDLSESLDVFYISTPATEKILQDQGVSYKPLGLTLLEHVTQVGENSERLISR